MLDNVWVMVGISLLFVGITLWLDRSNKTWKYASKIGQLNNLEYGIVNILFFVYAFKAFFDAGLFDSLHNMCCTPLPKTPTITAIFTIYYYSKMWEFLDIILVSLMGAPLHPHFQFHHCTTLSLAWTFLFYHSAHGAIFLLANVFMHIFLYLYLSQDRLTSNIFRNKIVFYIIRGWGHIQHILGIYMAGKSWMESRDGDDHSYTLVSLLHFLYFFVFFLIFIRVLLGTYFCMYHISSCFNMKFGVNLGLRKKSHKSNLYIVRIKT